MGGPHYNILIILQWCAAEQWCLPHPHGLRLLQRMHFTQTCMAVAMATAEGCEMRVTVGTGMRGDGPCVAAGVPYDWIAPRSVFTPSLDSPQVCLHPRSGFTSGLPSP